MKTKLLALILMFGVSVSAHAAWWHSVPSTPSTLTSLPNISTTVWAVVNSSYGQQWADIYYPSWLSTNDDWANIEGVYVHWHGGGWQSGAPRYEDPGFELSRNALRSLVERYVPAGWVFIDLSYPLSDGVGSYTLSNLLDGGSGSILNTFSVVFNMYLQWRGFSGKNLPLVLGGESAGSWVAQRVAARGEYRGYVSYTLVAGVPALQVGELRYGVCEAEYNSELCADYRHIWEYSESNGVGSSIHNLENYIGDMSTYPYTYYLVNSCDELAEAEDAMGSWFDYVEDNYRGTLYENINPDLRHRSFDTLYATVFQEVDGFDRSDVVRIHSRCSDASWTASRITNDL